MMILHYLFPYLFPYSMHSHGIYVWNKEREYDSVFFPLSPRFPNPTRLSNEFIRNMDVWFYGLNHKIEIEYQFWREHKIPTKRNYFSCMSVCSVGDNLDIIALNHSGRHTGTKNFNEKLMFLFDSKLKAFPYKRSTVTNLNHAVGNCAEQNAANDMINAKDCEVDEIIFSRTIRPRTMTFIAPCPNCESLFPQIVR